MKFVSPKVDYAFKKIFGSEQSKDILISFLNAIIYDGKKIIKSLTIINPFNPGQVISLKDTYLDIKAVLKDGSVVVIEMQIARMTAFSKRVMYNLVKGYGNQLKTGDDYPLLRPAIAVTITDFILFKDEVDFINPFVFKHRNKNWEYPDEELQLVFVELPKFKKTLSELKTLTDKWIYFLKEAASLDDIPETLGEVAEIEQALNIANRVNMTPEELEIVERRAIAFQDKKGRIDYAEQQGEAKGKLNQTIALILRMLKKRFGEIPAAIRSQVEDLPVEDLESLGEYLLDFNSLEGWESWLKENLIS